MDTSVEKKLDFARRGLRDSQFVYTAEICKNILDLQPDCIEARQILQFVSKDLYESKSFLGRLFAQVLSFFYLFSILIVKKESKLKMSQKAVSLYPKGKIALICFAQIGLKEGRFEIVLLAYEELYRIFPEEVSIGIALGETFLYMANYKDALEIGQRIFEKDPSNIEAMNLVEQSILGQMQVNLG